MANEFKVKNNLLVEGGSITDGTNTESIANIKNHVDSTSNPHTVTAAQVGAYTQEETNALFGGVNRNFYFSNDADGVIAGYTKLYDSLSSLGTKATITASSVSADDTLIEEFITETDQPDFTTLVKGVYDLHIHANVSAVVGNNTIRLYFKIFKRATGGTETLLATSEESNILTVSEAQYTLYAILDEDETIASDDRIVVKFYANVDTAGGTDPDVNLYVEGDTDSRIAIKAEITAFDSRYLQINDETATIEDIVKSGLGIIIDGGGAEITTGIKGDIEVPFDCSITAVTLLADQSGSIVIDIWKDTYANFAPTDADTITASAVPTISTAIKSQDTTLTGWTTSLSAGDILRFNVDSCSTITRCTVALKINKV